MLIRLHALIFLLLAVNPFQSFGQQGIINRGYKPSDFKRYNKLNCPTKFTDEIIQLIIDYALWRNIGMLYIVDESINSGCNMKAINQNLNCFSENGLLITLQRKFHKEPDLRNQPKRVLVVSFIQNDMNFQHYLEQINLLYDQEYNFKWLNIYADPDKSNATESKVLETLVLSRISLSVDIVIATASSNFTNTKKLFSENRCKRQHSPFTKNWRQTVLDTFFPFNHTKAENHSTYHFNVTFKELCGPNNDLHLMTFCMLQVYKIRKTINESFVVRPLGYWSFKGGTEKMKPFQTVEMRIDFHQLPLVFGKKQFSKDANLVSDENLIEDDNDEENMDKISEYILSFLNAKQSVKTYSTLGQKGANGNWSGLLGAVVLQEVDLGLDGVIKVPERYNDMIFTHDILRSIRNIYVKPEQSHSARDIFLAPFDPQLLLSVLITGIIFVIAMALYILFITRKSQERNVFTTHLFAISEAAFWMFGVFTMQGTQIQPKSYSGNIIVVSSLLFALIIYNAYSAFITSILSVKLIQIRTVDDLLKSDYDIGYAKKSQDEIYLRSMNQSQLNQIYLRGYLHNNINNITDGLLKATKGNYGFFATGHEARKQILKISGYRCKYEIMEIPVSSTKNSIAFPMSNTSPYRKVINLSLIRMMEAGVYQYINLLINPPLPQCTQQITYQSARLNDLITSFGLLGLGILIGSVIITFECFLKKKKQIYAKMKKKYKSMDQKIEFAH